MLERSTKSKLDFHIRKSINQEDVSLWMNPVFDATTGKEAGGDIIVDWPQSVQGILASNMTLTWEEQADLLMTLTRETFNLVNNELKVHPGRKISPLMLMININAVSLYYSEIIYLCQVFIEMNKGNHIMLVLNITSLEELDNPEETLRSIRALKGLGVMLCLDDFGIGHANYFFLMHFMPDFLKINKLLTSVGKSVVSKIVFENISGLAKKIGCRVIASEVNDENQKSSLVKLGATFLQGPILKKPLPLRDLLVQHYYI